MQRICAIIFWQPVRAALFAPVAQLDRVFDYESKGRGFESLLAHQKTERSTSLCSVFYCSGRDSCTRAFENTERDFQKQLAKDKGQSERCRFNLRDAKVSGFESLLAHRRRIAADKRALCMGARFLLYCPRLSNIYFIVLPQKAEHSLSLQTAVYCLLQSFETELLLSPFLSIAHFNA